LQGELPDGDTLPLMRLRYGGSAARWGFAMYLASKDGYEDAVLPTGAFAGLPEDSLDCAAGLYLGDPRSDQPPTNLQKGEPSRLADVRHPFDHPGGLSCGT
jgi:hypothetical protein